MMILLSYNNDSKHAFAAPLAPREGGPSGYS